MEIDGDTLNIKSSRLDLQEIRFSLLFWDRLVWPRTEFIRSINGPEEEFLEDAGILSRPMSELSFTESPAEFTAKAHVQTFLDPERNEPGCWALAQGERSLLLKGGWLEEGRAALVELHRAIPVPDKDVSLADVLEFREKRRDELRRLRVEVDTFYGVVANATDGVFELQRCVNQIELACIDLLRATKESRNPFRLANLKTSSEMRLGSIVRDGLLGAALGQQCEMATLGAIIGGAAGLLKISKDFGVKGTRSKDPYWYVYSFHREIFNEGG